MEVYLHAFLTSVVDVGERSASCSGSCTSGKERPVDTEEKSGWVGPTDVLDDLERWNTFVVAGSRFTISRSSNPLPGHCTHLAKPSNKHTAEVVNCIVEWHWNLWAARSWHYVTTQFLNTICADLATPTCCLVSGCHSLIKVKHRAVMLSTVIARTLECGTFRRLTRQLAFGEKAVLSAT